MLRRWGMRGSFSRRFLRSSGDEVVVCDPLLVKDWKEWEDPEGGGVSSLLSQVPGLSYQALEIGNMVVEGASSSHFSTKGVAGS